MDSIIRIAPLIAAVVGIIALVFSIRNSKGSINKRIERKQSKIHDLEQSFYRTHGLNDDMRRHWDYQEKRNKLENDIDELRKRL